MKPSISVIISTLNEEATIYDVVSGVPKKIGSEYVETIVVDGLSTDSTVENAEKVGARVVLERRRGKGIAMHTGVDAAYGDKIVFMDGDGTYSPKEIPQCIEKLENSDVVIGNVFPHLKKVAGRRLKSRLHYLSYTIVQFLYSINGVKLEDPLNGMRAIRKKDYYQLGLKSEGFGIETEMNIKILRKNLKIGRVPMRYSDRKEGSSKFLFDFSSHFQILKMLRSY